MRRAAVLAALLLAAGCSGGGRTAAPAHQRAAAVARTNEVIVAVQSDARTLDPHAATDAASMRFIENLYSGLLRYGEAYGTFEPDLATEWAVSDDGLVYTFTLRTNAFFHGSGRRVTATDAAYSLDRMRTGGVRAAVFAPVRSVAAADASTVVVTLATPLSSLPAHLAHPMSAIVDRAAVEGGGLERQGGGCGPFRLVEWKRQQQLRLEADPRYFRPGLPHIRTLTYRPIPDETARTTALRNGEVDILLDVAGKDVAGLREVPGIVVESQPGTFWEYIGLNCTRPPFDDIRVRQAVAWAVDRALLNQLVTFGRATVLDGGPIPPNHWAHADLTVYPEPDLERARALLTEAGRGDGLDVELLVGSDFPYQVKAAEAIKQMLRAVDIRVTVRAQESGVFFSRLGEGDFSMAVAGWLGMVDPDEWLGLLFRSGADWNQQGFSDPAVDALIEQGRAERERVARRAVYRQAQERVAGAAPMVFLYANERTSAHLADVTGFINHPTVTTISLRDVRVER